MWRERPRACGCAGGGRCHGSLLPGGWPCLGGVFVRTAASRGQEASASRDSSREVGLLASLFSLDRSRAAALASSPATRSRRAVLLQRRERRAEPATCRHEPSARSSAG